MCIKKYAFNLRFHCNFAVVKKKHRITLTAFNTRSSYPGVWFLVGRRVHGGRELARTAARLLAYESPTDL